MRSWTSPWQCDCQLRIRVPSGQSNRPACGGARLLGNGGASIGRAFSFRWVSIFSMTTGSSMQAITLTPVGPEKACHVLLLMILQSSVILWLMVRLLQFLLSLLTSTIRTRLSLQLEIAALRHQLSLYQSKGRRPRIAPADRLLWSVVARLWSGWRIALYLCPAANRHDLAEKAISRVLANLQPKYTAGSAPDRARAANAH